MRTNKVQLPLGQVPNDAQQNVECAKKFLLWLSNSSHCVHPIHN